MGVKRRTSGILGRIRRSVPWLKPYHLVTLVILGILLAHGLMIFPTWIKQSGMTSWTPR